MSEPSNGPKNDGPVDETEPYVPRDKFAVGGGDTGTFLSKLNLTDWITAIGTAVIALATIVNVIIVNLQLREMHSSGVDTHNLADATSHLSDHASEQARALDKLRVAGEAQARAMDKLRAAGESQAKAADALTDAGRAQALATSNLAANSARQLDAIQANAEAAKTQAASVQEQAKATLESSKATDRLASAGQAQADALVKSLEVAKAANDISAKASVAADRPWVSISMPGDIEPVAGQDYKAEFYVSNVGRSPALNAVISIDFRIIKITDTFNSVITKCQGLCQQYTLFPSGGGFQAAGLTFHPTMAGSLFAPEEIKRIQDRQDVVLLVARMDYVDTSGNPHVTNSCMFLSPKLGFTSCPAGGQAN